MANVSISDEWFQSFYIFIKYENVRMCSFSLTYLTDPGLLVGQNKQIEGITVEPLSDMSLSDMIDSISEVKTVLC